MSSSRIGSEADGRRQASWASLAFTTFLLIAIYSAYGVLQERILKGRYEIPSIQTTSEDKFTSAPLLVLCNRLVSLFAGLLLVLIRPGSATPSSILPVGGSSDNQQSVTRIIAPRIARLRPASPLICYALIACLNNAATSGQYMSLSYLSFTTATLGKCAKMVPALIIGSLLYGKRYQRREWIGALVVISGICGYLNSLPKPKLNEEEQQKATATNWMGLACLMGYLLFDGLTSTTQEWLFGKAKHGRPGDGQLAPNFLGLTPSILDHLVWVNVFSSIVAFIMLAISPGDSTASSIKLALASSVLQVHIIMLSLAATCGLLVLFHVIATYGALIAGLIMTLRQFVSVVCNALWFGNMTNISISGWASIGFVAAGVWIKMDRQYDTQAREKGYEALSSTTPRASGDEKPLLSDEPRVRYARIRQYFVPLIICPSAFVALFTIFTLLLSGSPIHVSDTAAVTSTSAPIQPSLAEPTVAAFAEPTVAAFAEPTIAALETTPKTPQYTEHEPTTHKAESGNIWDEKLIELLDPLCPPGPINAIRYPAKIRTALATFPRSGSSYTRTLIERATGYLTSSVYCDGVFDEFFLGECDLYSNPFLVKTHYPSIFKHENETSALWYSQFDRYLEVVRNPIDVMWSLQNMLTTFGQDSRVDGMRFSNDSHHLLKPHLDEWNKFINYWDAAPIQGYVIRYEDFRKNPLVHIMQIVSFLLPPAELPSLSRIACALQLDKDKEMYASRKISPFQDWEEHFTPETFDWVIEQVAENWCKMGYDQLLLEVRGTRGPVDCMALRKEGDFGAMIAGKWI